MLTARHLGRRPRAALLLLLAAGAGLLLLFGPAWPSAESPVFLPGAGRERVAVVLLAIAGAAAALQALRRGSGTRAALSIAMALGAVLAVEGVSYPSRYRERLDLPAFARQAAPHLPAGTPLLAHPDAGLAYDFYLRRPIRELREPTEAAAFLSVPRAAALLTSEAAWARLRGAADPSWRPVAATGVGRRRVLLLRSLP